MQDIKPGPSQVCNLYEIGFDPEVLWRNMICTNKFFTGDIMWRIHSGEIAPPWCTSLIFNRDEKRCFIPPVLVKYINHYTWYIHYNIPRYWVVQNSPSGYMDFYGWLKAIYHLSSMCGSSHINSQVLLYHGHGRYFYYRSLNILLSHHIKAFIIKLCESLHS